MKAARIVWAAFFHNSKLALPVNRGIIMCILIGHISFLLFYLLLLRIETTLSICSNYCFYGQKNYFLYGETTGNYKYCYKT